MMRSDASLKGKIKALAKKSNLKPQELLQMYLFEHLLMRLGKSGYAEAFVLKGGLLISSMTGVAQRTTMDMDTTVIGMDMDEGMVSEAVAAICAVDVADGMEYSFERIEPIREGDEYANWRAHLRARYGKIDVPVKIDITTEDEIVPGRIEYRYPLMFEEGSVRVLSYPLETVLAEKLETVVSRGIANTRGRDYYDIHTLFPARSRCRHRLQARFTRHDGRLRGRARRGQKIRYDAGHLVLLRLGITLCGRPQDEGEAKQDAFKYIELYYSRQRMRSSIGYNAPCDLERDVA